MFSFLFGLIAQMPMKLLNLGMAVPSAPPSGHDWLPGNRDGRIQMGKVWQPLIASKGPLMGMSAAEQNAFDDAVAAADEANQTNIATQSPHTAEAALEADEALETMMRYIHKHYILVPPLTKLDLVDFHLGTGHSRTVIPTAPNGGRVTGFNGIDAHLLEVFLTVAGEVPVGFTMKNYSYQVHFGVVDPTGESTDDIWRHIAQAPVSGADLPNFLQTNHRSLRLDLSESDRGKPIWFCVCLVNEKGYAGPWGPLFSTVVP